MTKIRDFEVDFEETNTGDLELIKGSQISFKSIIKKVNFPGNKEEHQYSLKLLESDKEIFANEKFSSIQIPRTRSKSFGEKMMIAINNRNSGTQEKKPKTPRVFTLDDSKSSNEREMKTSPIPTRRKTILEIFQGIISPSDKNLSNTTIKIYKCFGEDLEKVTSIEKTNCPKALTFLIDHLIKNKFEEEKGIFRISAQKSVIQSLQEVLDKGEKVDVEKFLDLNIFACVFKQYFRLLPVPLLTFDLYDAFLLINLLPLEERAGELIKLVKLLSKPRRGTLYQLMKLLKIVEGNSKVNMMDAGNLSIVFGVSVLIPKSQTSDPIAMFQESQKSIAAFSNFFKLWDKIQDAFDDVKE